MMNKKAFELSVNFLVIMIIMVVIFGFGIYLFSNVFSHVTKMDTELHESEMEKLNYLLDNDELVTVLNPQQTYDGDALRFPIGITNEKGEAADQFTINLDECKFTLNDAGTSIDCIDDGVVIYPTQGFPVKNNQRIYRLILVDPTKVSGNSDGFYSVKFHIKRGLDVYPESSTQMLWVSVP